ncbi:BTB/POZ domain-containing protein NPY1-like [Hibiscus syriacus]|nr:BTB/POZ domain-containing protein NPY1-like [Hibiscus syriacus]
MEDLVQRVSLKLHEASLKDLIIPARPPQTTLYDVEMVHSIVKQYMMHEKLSRDSDLGKSDVGCNDFILGHGTLLSVGKMIDGYLEEIARDPNLSLASSLTRLSQSLSLLDRFMMNWAYGHDEGRKKGTVWLELQLKTDEEWEKTAAEDCSSIKKQMNRIKIKEDGSKLVKNSKNKKCGMQMLPSRLRRIFDKLWVVGKGHGENKSSKTSGSSQSPAAMIPGDTKSSAKHRRHSIS